MAGLARNLQLAVPRLRYDIVGMGNLGAHMTDKSASPLCDAWYPSLMLTLRDREFGNPMAHDAKLAIITLENMLRDTKDELTAEREGRERAERDVERGYQALEACGVSRERAKNLGNGIQVLETRFQRGLTDNGIVGALAYERAAEVCMHMKTSQEKYPDWYAACDACKRAILAHTPGPAAQALEEMKRDAGRYVHLQNLPIVRAQAFFWNYESRKERSKAIDADMAALDAAQSAKEAK